MSAPCLVGLVKTVLRLLDSNAQTLRLSSLITNDRVLDQLRSLIRQPFGIILVVGPTGPVNQQRSIPSINEINVEGINIVTAEDPIEYTLPESTRFRSFVKKCGFCLAFFEPLCGKTLM